MANTIATTIGLGRPAAVGVGPTSAVTGLAEDSSSPAGTGTTCVAWSTTYPTAPTNYLRRVSFPATTGTGIIWTFPRGLVIPVSGNLVLWNIAASTLMDVYMVWDE